MNQTESIKEIRNRARDIVTVDLANEIAGAWGFTADELGVIVEREEGADWGERSWTSESGPSVGIYHLATALVRKMGGTVESSPYMGAGKSAEWYSLKAAAWLESVSVEGRYGAVGRE